MPQYHFGADNPDPRPGALGPDSYEVELVGISSRSFDRATAAAQQRASSLASRWCAHRGDRRGIEAYSTTAEVTKMELCSSQGSCSYRVHLRVTFLVTDEQREEERRATLARWLNRLSA